MIVQLSGSRFVFSFSNLQLTGLEQIVSRGIDMMNWGGWIRKLVVITVLVVHKSVISLDVQAFVSSQKLGELRGLCRGHFITRYL